MDLEELRKQLLERLEKQKERHDGGSHWVGTGGTSPFGTGGAHPTGIRVGGGGGRSALAVADARRFREFRRDLVLDTRQIAAALRRLRRLTRDDGKLVLDLDETIDATARNCGDIEVVLSPERHADVRLLLLLDVGGSMDPHAQLVSRLFSAAHQGGGFKELRSYYFHNCVYQRVFEDAAFSRPVQTPELLKTLDTKWTVVVVGDAYMHPGELTMTSGDWWESCARPLGPDLAGAPRRPLPSQRLAQPGAAGSVALGHDRRDRARVPDVPADPRRPRRHGQTPASPGPVERAP